MSPKTDNPMPDPDEVLDVIQKAISAWGLGGFQITKSYGGFALVHPDGTSYIVKVTRATITDKSG